MRTIRFRGKRIDEPHQWEYGYIEVDGKDVWMHTIDGRVMLAIPETIGQFTGLYDKNGKEIYEGDIVQSESGEFVYQVVFNETRFASFGLKREQDMFLHYFGEAIEADKCEVIGNVFDNHELMEGGQK